MNILSNKEKDKLLELYYVPKKAYYPIIIIFSSLILITSIIIIILCATSTNELYEDEELLPGYIPINSIEANYYISDTSQKILLYNPNYSYLIHTIKIDEEKISEVNNKLSFNTSGEHTVKLSLKKPLKTTENFFMNCKELISVNLSNLTNGILPIRFKFRNR